MRIILLGAPGSGKGTQASVLVEKFSVPHISTGELLRAEMASDSPLGKEISAGMESGQFVPNEVVMELIQNRLRQSDTRRGFILDGFPRNIPQAQALDSALALMGRSLQLVLYLSVEHDQIVKRLTGRLICASCGAVYNQHFSKPKKRGVCDKCESNELERRPDDTKEVITGRVATFLKETEPLIAYYRAQHKLRTVNGEEKIATISEKIIDIINAEIRPLDIKVVDVPVEGVYVSDSNTIIAGGAVVKTETDNSAKRNVPQSRTIEKVKEKSTEKITRKKRGRKKAVVEAAAPTQNEPAKATKVSKDKSASKTGKKASKKAAAKKASKKAAKKVSV
ncbi:MAG: adenylate kinase, partial [Gammaproteobacteria bacterium]|nr:adenylate kinase [Gammaproteobacteria bacterium]